MLENLFYNILFFSFLIPPILYVILFHKIGRDKKIITLVTYCVYTFLYLILFEKTLTESEIVYIPQWIRNPIYTFIEFTFFAVLLFQQIRIRKFKTILIGLYIFFFVFQIFYFIAHNKNILQGSPLFIRDFVEYLGFTQKKQNNLDSIPIGVEAILVFIFIFFFLYEQLLDVKDTPIYDNYFFWVSIGLLIYLGGSLFIYIYANTLTPKEMDKYWFFTYIVEIIKNLFFTSAVYVFSKHPNKIKSTQGQGIPNLDFMF